MPSSGATRPRAWTPWNTGWVPASSGHSHPSRGCPPVRVAGAAVAADSDAVFGREHLPHDLDEFGIREIEQAAVAGHPLIGVQQPGDLPLPVDAGETVLVPAVLRVFGRAGIGRLPMSRHHVDDRRCALAVDGRAEIRVLMMAPHRAQYELGKARP